MNAAPMLIIVSILIILASLPLIFRMVKMNPIYGVRIPEAFRSETRWYQINRFGGIITLFYGVALGITGIIGLKLERSQLAKFEAISIGIVFGGMAVMMALILIYAAMTKKK